jgi:hypothetical protein
VPALVSFAGATTHSQRCLLGDDTRQEAWAKKKAAMKVEAA